MRHFAFLILFFFTLPLGAQKEERFWYIKGLAFAEVSLGVKGIQLTDAMQTKRYSFSPYGNFCYSYRNSFKLGLHVNGAFPIPFVQNFRFLNSSYKYAYLPENVQIVSFGAGAFLQYKIFNPKYYCRIEWELLRFYYEYNLEDLSFDRKAFYLDLRDLPYGIRVHTISGVLGTRFNIGTWRFFVDCEIPIYRNTNELDDFKYIPHIGLSNIGIKLGILFPMLRAELRRIDIHQIEH